MKSVLLAGGLGLATVFGALFAYNSRKSVARIPRQKIMATVKQLRQDMFMVLVEIAYFVKQNASKCPPDQLREYVLSPNSSFMENISKKLENVFNQFTEEEFQQNIEKYYQNDLEITYHLNRYQEEFNKSVLGVTPQFKEEVVTFLTAQKLLLIIEEILEAKFQRITEKISEKMTNQQMVTILRAQHDTEKAFRSERLKKLGLVGKDDELTQIFEFSVAKYLKIDSEFQKKYNILLQSYTLKYQDHVDRFCNFERPIRNI